MEEHLVYIQVVRSSSLLLPTIYMAGLHAILEGTLDEEELYLAWPPFLKGSNMFTFHYLWWIPCLIIYYAIYGWLAKQNNLYGGSWMWKTFVFGALCPFWLMVSRISKNLLFDGLLYNNIMHLTFIATMLLLKEGNTFETRHWIGLTFITLGSIMIRT